MDKVHQAQTLRRFYRKPGALLLTIAIIVIGGALTTWLLVQSTSMRINRDNYQAVQLINGQTYFGKLQNTSGEYLVLKSPYTAQTAQPQSSQNTTVSDTQTTLVKLSEQVLGPEDSIAFRSDQVLFWQNLREDSKVTAAIEAKQ